MIKDFNKLRANVSNRIMFCKYLINKTKVTYNKKVKKILPEQDLNTCSI